MANYEFYRWCRLCAKDDSEDSVKIFSKRESGQDSEMVTAIRKYFEVKINHKDKLSKVLCTECHTLVTSLITFDNRVQNVQAMYIHLQNKESVQPEDIQEARFQYGLMDDECEQLEQIEDGETLIKIEKLWTEDEEDELIEQADLVEEKLDDEPLPAEETIVVNKVEEVEQKPKVKKVYQTKKIKPKKGRRNNSVKVPISIRQDTVKYTHVGSSSAVNSAAKLNVSTSGEKTNEMGAIVIADPTKQFDAFQIVVRKDTIKYKVNNVILDEFDGQIIETLDESDGDAEIHEGTFNEPQYEINFESEAEASAGIRKTAQHSNVYNGKRRKLNDDDDSDHEESTTYKHKFECNVCGKKYKYQSAYCKHMEELHKVKIEKEDISRAETPPPFIELLDEDVANDDDGVVCDVSCRRCGQQFDSIPDLNQHTEKVHLICSICGHRSRGFDFLKEHIQSHIRYKCDVCLRSFNSMYKLEQHTAIHNGTCSAAKPFQYTNASQNVQS